MPVISFVSPKGGVGKTTAALILATELANKTSKTVTLIDADPNLPLSKWAKLPGVPKNMEVIADTGEATIVDSIDAARKRSAFVVVDLEGVASGRVTNAVAMSDLAVIPIQASVLDAEQAARAVALVRTTAKSRGRDIPYRILFNRVSASGRIRTRNFKTIATSMDESGILAFTVQLAEREAYRSMFSHGGTLDTLTNATVTTIETARENASALAAEVIDVLRKEMGK